MNTARYSFGPLSTRGVFAGLRLGQILLLLNALVAAAVLFALAPNGPGFAGALTIVGVGLLAAFVTPGGKGVDQWAPVVVRYAFTRRRHVDVMPLLGHTPGSAPTPTLPPTVKGLSIIGAQLDGQGQIGVIKDPREGTWTAMLAARGGAFPLLSEADKAVKLDAWGRVLSELAKPSSPVHRLQWVQRTVPDDGDALRRDLTERSTVQTGDPALDSYRGLLAEAQPVTQDHETMVALQISGRRALRAIRRAGGGDTGATRVLLRQLEQLAESLTEAGVRVDGALPPRMVAKAVRTGFDPSTRDGLARQASAEGRRPGVAVEQAWPHATEHSWRSYRTDGAVHVTYWVTEWPRVDSGPGLLEPLMLTTRAMRTVAVTMEPRNPLKAQREVEHTLTDRDANEAVRARYGFATRFRHTLEREADERRRAELAFGHGEYRFAGYVTVTAASLDELEDACADVEQRAQQSGLDIRRLYGQQDQAFCFTLPLARGLR